MRPTAVAFLPVVVAGFLAAPAGSAAGAEPRLFLLHDVPDDGYTYVGDPVHFGYILLDAERKTTVHHQGVVRVTQNDVLLYETSLDAGHDYNVLNTFEIAFPTTGPYLVHAEVPLSGSVTAQADFVGFVHANPKDVAAKVMIEQHQTPASAGVPVDFTVSVVDAAGQVIPHSDATVEVRRPGDDWLLFRTHLHTHDKPMDFSLAFPLPGDYLVRAVGYMAYPTEDGAHFEPAAATHTVEVAAGGLFVGSRVPSLPSAAGGGDYRILTTADPQDSNTPFSRFVLSGLVFDAKNDAFVPHVNLQALVTDAAGQGLFWSDSLHEYDGHYDVVLNWPVPGLYTLALNAQRGEWAGQSKLDFRILETLPPGGTPLVSSAGAVVVTADGLQSPKSGIPQAVKFTSSTPAGTPSMHSEIDFQLLRTAWGPSYLQNKVHTHASGSFEVTITFPEPGDWLLVVDPVNIHGEPDLGYYYGDVGGSLVVPVKVAPGVPLPAVAEPPVPVPQPAKLEGKALPAAGALVALAAAALAVLGTRRPR